MEEAKKSIRIEVLIHVGKGGLLGVIITYVIKKEVGRMQHEHRLHKTRY